MHLMLDLDSLKNSHVYETLSSLDSIYNNINETQQVWIDNSPIHCPDGCGQCCFNFEPDVYETEALYLAAWLLTNKKQMALDIANDTFISPREKSNITDKGTGCFLFDPDSPYHCTVYEGRPLICRMFGYSGDEGKNGEIRWKPCRFIPQEKLESPITHRQYTEEELLKLFGNLPPIMVDAMTQVLALSPDSAAETELLHTALKKAINKLLLILKFLEPPEPNSPSTPEPNTPLAA